MIMAAATSGSETAPAPTNARTGCLDNTSIAGRMAPLGAGHAVLAARMIVSLVTAYHNLCIDRVAVALR